MKWPDLSKDRYVYAILGVLLLVEFLFFRQFAEREIIWAYPNHHDQLDFLFPTYDLYTGFLNRGFAALKDYVTTPSARSLLFPIHGFLLCLLFGATRLTCLEANFLLFGALQATFLYTGRWLTGNLWLGFVGVGLVLSQASAFFYAGGMFDYRTDFSAYCLYGIWILVVLRSGVFANTKWTIVAALVGTWLILVRYITVPYVLGATLLTAVGISLRYRTGLFDAKEGRERIVRASLFLTIVAFLTAPFLYLATRSIWKYYGSHHFVGPEKYLRAAEHNISGLLGHLTFYPASIWYEHLGRPFVLLSVILLFVAYAMRWVQRDYRSPKGADAGHTIFVALFVAAAILTPLITLTVIITKSQVVGGIVGVPIALAVLLAIAHIVRKTPPVVRSTLQSSRGCAILAVISMAFGMGNYLGHLTGRGPFQDRRMEIAHLMWIYETIGRYVKITGPRPTATFSVNLISGAMNYMVVPVVFFERQGVLIRMNPLLGNSIFAVDRDTAFKKLEETDILVLGDTSQRFHLSKHYPLNLTLTPLTMEIERWAANELVHLLSTPSVEGRGYSVYVRAAMGVTGLMKDKRFPSQGVCLTGLGQVIAERPRCVIEGTLDQPNHGIPTMKATLYRKIGLPVFVPVEVEQDGLRLKLTLDFSHVLFRADGEVMVILKPAREADLGIEPTETIFRWDQMSLKRSPDMESIH